jgi:hypothetical protein
MSVITYFTDHSSPLENIKGVVQNATNTIDFSKAPVTALDTVQLLHVPIGAIVKSIDIVTITAAGAACTMGVGDGSTATLFDAAVSLNTTATHTGTDPATETALVATNGKYYAAAGYIVGTMAHTNAVAKFIISADYIIPNISHA